MTAQIWPKDAAEIERQGMEKLSPLLLPYSELANALQEFAPVCFREIREVTGSFDAPARVQLRLVNRISADVRALELLTERGYVQQAWTLLASIFEHAFRCGFIGKDDERAAKWLSYEGEQGYPDVYSAIDNTVRLLGLPDNALSKEHGFYKDLCELKHAHPKVQRYY